MPSLPHEPQRVIRANGIDLCVEIFGEETAPPLILIMGLGAQMIIWDEDFCQQLAGRGFRVIRFDNRDIGRSSRMQGNGRISMMEMMAARLFGRRMSAPYLLVDMARDVIGLMDALGLATAHLVGASMGGMIAQECAIHFPHRLLSLTSIMSSTGSATLPPPTPEAMGALMRTPARDKAGFIAQFCEVWRVLRAGSFPADEALDPALGARVFERGVSADGVARQFRAILASGDRTWPLGQVRAPTLVIHGERDPLLRVEAGRATARAIPGAKLLILPQMGHALPRIVWDQVIGAIADHAKAAGTAGAMAPAPAAR